MQNIWSLALVVWMGTVVCHQLLECNSLFLLHSVGCAMAVILWPIQNAGHKIRLEAGIKSGMFLMDFIVC